MSPDDLRPAGRESVSIAIDGRWLRVQADVFVHAGADALDDAFMARLATALDKLGVVCFRQVSITPIHEQIRATAG